MRNGKEAEAVNGTLNDQSSIYLQIAKMLEDSILRGIYQEGEQVPSTNELARQYSINPATAAKGINLLVDEGVLYKKRGIGMFVSEGAVALVQQKRRAAFYQQYVTALAKEAKSLGLGEEELAGMIRRAYSEAQ
ncbi:GntR family transcriptional regulator [Allofournierella massiliensis]|uniref:GntR family transcriptional regulator n=1 Tax=Allofournierella massiliensis TaxID=1650663 RepID=A0ABT7UTR8_9FIRM|nr:GntR family transcriptional regulator [Fournierella massiliensis]MDM8202272.1 GntR family transcriptional regulator [Fournierella massiliensis]